MMRHPNLLFALDAFISPSGREVYIVTDKLDSTLHDIITTQPLQLPHITYFMYQILLGLKVRFPWFFARTNRQTNKTTVLALGKRHSS